MSANEPGGSHSKPRGTSPSRAPGPATPEHFSTRSSLASSAGPSAGPSTRKEPSLGVHAPGIQAVPRRARSIHINIKPDPVSPTSIGLPLPSWLAGAASSTKTAASPAGAVPHRDFGMAPHRRASESHTHGRALSAIAAASLPSSSIVAGAPTPGAAASRSARWANTVRNQLRHIERDGLRRTFLGRRTLAPTATQQSQTYLSKLWDRVRRLPELLLVEYEDPVDSSSPWHDPAEDHESSDTSDLLDEPGSTKSSAAKTHARRASRRRPGQLRRVHRALERTRRTLGVSRAAMILLLLLLILGIYESTRLSGSSSRKSVFAGHPKFRIYPHDPFRSLKEAGVDNAVRGIPAPASARAVKDARNGIATSSPPRAHPKVAAILLNWKRLDNLVVVLAHLCMHTEDIFESIHVWNNNPDVLLTHATFMASKCPRDKLRLHNSPGNLLFMGRFMACSVTQSPYCYFQDDDWLVPTLSAGHAHFMRNPGGPSVILTGDEFPVKEGWEWCFSNADFDLNTCFAWLGTGSFVSRQQVLETLKTASLAAPSLEAGVAHNFGPVAGDEVAMLDNVYTTFQNKPPYVLAGQLIPMPQTHAFTAGDGTAGDIRNEIYIQKGVDRLANTLGVLRNLSPYPPPLTPWPVDTSQTSQTISPYRQQSPAYKPHPYFHHSRAVALEGDRIFLTNVANLPPPNALAYQPSSKRNLSQWEHALGETAELWRDGKDWALTWGYVDAVDGDYRTAWRSPDVIREGDYIGLDLLSQIMVEQQPSIKVNVVLETSDTLLPHLKTEVSIDGYNWQEFSPAPKLACHVTGHLSTQPHPSFPSTFLTSSAAQHVLKAEADGKSSGSRSWTTSRTRLQSCEVVLSTSAGGMRRKGWRFVRFRSLRDMPVGWGLYEMWVA